MFSDVIMHHLAIRLPCICFW